MTHRMQCAERPHGFPGACIGDLMMPGDTAFARMPGFSVLDRDATCVAEFKPPLVNDASTEGTPPIA